MQTEFYFETEKDNIYIIIPYKIENETLGYYFNIQQYTGNYTVQDL